MKKTPILIAFGSVTILALGILTYAATVRAALLLLLNDTSFVLFLAGTVILSFAILLEWRVILPSIRRSVDRMQFRSLRVISTSVMTLGLLIMTAQIAGIVYAMSYSLLWSTSQTNETVSIVMGDYNGDGHTDWIAYHLSGVMSSHDLYINSGTGGFSRSTFGNAQTTTSYAVGDPDGDGDLDAYYFRNSGDTLERCKNNGSASFSCVSIFTYTFQNNNNAVFADFDNDGDQDLLKSDSSAAGTVHFVRNTDRKGTLTVFTGASIPILGNRTMRSADMNSDGYLDFVAVNSNADPLVYINSGTGSFTQSYISALSLRNTVALADFDADGDIDIAVADSANNFYVLANNGIATSFSAGSTTAAGGSVNGMGTGDLDNDGDMDLVLALATGGSKVYFNNGSGVFSENGSATETGDVSNVIGVADTDADGDIDYIRGTASTYPNRVYTSDQSATLANSAPSAPSTLVATSMDRVKSGSIFADDSGVGSIVWATTSNASASDDAYSAATSMTAGNITHYLKATGFGFNLPSDATIYGIKAEVERKYTGTFAARDYAVRIVKGGTIQTTDFSGSTLWPAADAYATYGGSTQLWGTTWTAADINASTFGFAIAMTGDSGSGGGSIDHIRLTVYSDYGNITLSWGSGSDAQTVARMLQYQVKMGTGSNTNNTVSGFTTSPHWVTRLLPNGQSRKYALQNIKCGLTYYWSVATVDTAFKSTWSTEQTIPLSATCNIPETVSLTGGGWSWTIFRQVEKAPPRPPKGTLGIQAFLDITGDGLRSDSESLSGFKSLPVTIHGTTDAGKEIKKTVTMDERGRIVVLISPGTYTVTIDTDSLVLKGKKPTTPFIFEDIVLTSNATENIEVGFRDENLLTHKPCLTIGTEGVGITGESDAETLIRRLRNGYGESIAGDIPLEEPLMTRRTFLRLVTSLHCVNLPRTIDNLKDGLRKTFEKKIVPGWTSIELRDVKLSAFTDDVRLVYGLLVEGLPVLRSSSAGPIGDLDSPISRREAVQIITSVLHLTDEKRADRGLLPDDLSLDDPIVPDLFTLQSLKVVPESFLPIFGPARGMSPAESSLFLVRSAFVAGKINLLPNIFLKSASAKQKLLARDLPNFSLPAAVKKDTGRPDRLTFTDILPGDTLAESLRIALAFGTPNKEGSMHWLIPGTARLSEFGVDSGIATLHAEDPATMLEVVRSLTILAGLGLPTRAAVLTGADKRDAEGSGEFRVTTDQLSNLPRNATLPSRILYRAQDHLRVYNMSLFSPAPWLLATPARSPGESLTIEEAADFFASTLISIAVRQGLVPPSDADKKMQSLRQRIPEYLIGTNIDWKNESMTKNTIFSRGMLIELLGTVLREASNSATEEFTSDLTPGMFWWSRVSE